VTAAVALAADSSPEAPLGRGEGLPRLEELIAAVWDGLATHRVVECPACGGRMEPEYGAGARPIAGRCGDCGSILS
jgi:hypothetical protein